MSKIVKSDNVKEVPKAHKRALLENAYTAEQARVRAMDSNPSMAEFIPIGYDSFESEFLATTRLLQSGGHNKPHARENVTEQYTALVTLQGNFNERVGFENIVDEDNNLIVCYVNYAKLSSCPQSVKNEVETGRHLKKKSGMATYSAYKTALATKKAQEGSKKA